MLPITGATFIILSIPLTNKIVVDLLSTAATSEHFWGLFQLPNCARIGKQHTYNKIQPANQCFFSRPRRGKSFEAKGAEVFKNATFVGIVSYTAFFEGKKTISRQQHGEGHIIFRYML